MIITGKIKRITPTEFDNRNLIIVPKRMPDGTRTSVSLWFNGTISAKDPKDDTKFVDLKEGENWDINLSLYNIQVVPTKNGALINKLVPKLQ